MPQIRPTINVVVTTLIVIVTKVFDLVKATTNGANRTNVLANEMFDQLRDRNFTSSSAFAVVLAGAGGAGHDPQHPPDAAGSGMSTTMTGATIAVPPPPASGCAGCWGLCLPG